MAKYEEKFIVINKKHLSKLCETEQGAMLVDNLEHDLENISALLPSNKYYVCNQDEPYAQKVIDTIIAGENSKGL